MRNSPASSVGGGGWRRISGSSVIGDRKRQIPWVVLGLTVTFASATIFGLWSSSLSNRTAVLVADREIPGGATIEVADLRTVEIASGQGADFVSIDDLNLVVGNTARALIPQGAALHPDLVAARPPLDEGMAVVGAVLRPGEYPMARLNPGQEMGVVLTTEQSVVAQATVAEVSEVLDSGQDALFVSLLVDRSDAGFVSQAAATGELRLILLPVPPQPEATVNDSQEGRSVDDASAQTFFGSIGR